MSYKDEAAETAKMVGGWENLARGLHELVTTGGVKLLDEAFKREGSKRLSLLFCDAGKRGAPKKFDFDWYVNVSNRLEQIHSEDNPPKSKKLAFEKLAEELYGEEWRGWSKTKKAQRTKTLQNQLLKFVSDTKKVRALYGSGSNASYMNLDDPDDHTDRDD